MAEREARMPKQPSEAARGAGVLWDPTVACRDEHLGGGASGGGLHSGLHPQNEREEALTTNVWIEMVRDHCHPLPLRQSHQHGAPGPRSCL